MEDTRLAEVFLSHEGRVSDKWEHYLGIYEAELSRFAAAGRPVRLLEVGVQNGGSLEIWSRYFPAGSTIVGIDIDPACGSLSESENVKILIADGGDPTSMSSALGEQHFDVIIDDGSHRSSDIVATFRCCFPRLERGGIYIIEDLHASYWPSMGGGFRQAGAAVEWLKGLVDALNSDHFDDEAAALEDLDELRATNTEICRLAFYDSVAVMEKRSVSKSHPYRRLLTGQEASIWQPFKVIASGSTDAARNFLFSESASRAMNAALLDELGAAREDRRTLMDQLSAEQADRRTLIDRLNTEREDRRALIDRLNTEREDRRALSSQLSAEREDSRALRASLASKEASLAKLRSWLAQTGRMLNESKAKVEELGSTLGERTNDLANARAKAEDLGRDLASTRALVRAIHASTSWRLTTPLRWLGKYYRKARVRVP